MINNMTDDNITICSECGHDTHTSEMMLCDECGELVCMNCIHENEAYEYECDLCFNALN